MEFSRKNSSLINKLIVLTSMCFAVQVQAKSVPVEVNAFSILQQLVGKDGSIGAREAGSKKEQLTAEFVRSQFEKYGYASKTQAFSFMMKDEKKMSQNVIAMKNNDASMSIVVGAHMDSTSSHLGSVGATDNGAGLAALLQLAANLQKVKSPYNLIFIAFGAEEVGLQGAKAYAKEYLHGATHNIVGMINLDTIAGGDKVYVHSASQNPYSCLDKATYQSSSVLRNAILATQKRDSEHQIHIHPKTKDYAEGETGGWSDHAPFACYGIPIAYIEATNFTINGKSGFDGYSQSTAHALWDCYDKHTKGACNRDTENKWGQIWHTEFDTLDRIEAIYPGRIERQMNLVVDAISQFLLTPAKFGFVE